MLMKNAEKELERVGRTCPECGGELVYRNGRFGKFISCINFPTCRYTENNEDQLPEEAKEEKICPNCGAKMVIKKVAMVNSGHVRIIRNVRQLNL